MYRIFIKPTLNQTTAVSGLTRLKEGTISSYKYMLDYYRQTGSYINNDHLLIRLLYMLADSYTGKNSIVYDRVRNDLDSITSSLSITTYSNPGILHYKEFYSDYCAIISTIFDEIMVFDYEGIDFKEIRPVRVLNHSMTNSLMVLPEVGSKIKDVGISVVGIDLPLLALMFNKWNEINKAKTTESQETPAMFITRYVLPNMIPEQVDIALRNTLMQRKLNNPTEVYSYTHKAVIDYTEETIVEIEHSLNRLNLQHNHYLRDLMMLPMVFNDSVLDSIPQGITELSKYSYWVTLLVYIDWLYVVLILLPKRKDYSSNMISQLRDVNRFIKSSHALRFMNLPTRLAFNAKYGMVLNIVLGKEQ